MRTDTARGTTELRRAAAPGGRIMPRRHGAPQAAALVGFFGTAILLAAAGCTDAADGTVRVESASGKILPVTVEVVATEQSRALGLMYRDELPEGRGMLFIFPDSTPRSFWMRNTRIPLDILYLDDDGRIVGLQANARPLSETPLPSGAPCRFVLEVPGGWAARHDVAIGVRVDLGALATTPAH